jgi:hypothetical protein
MYICRAAGAEDVEAAELVWRLRSASAFKKFLDFFHLDDPPYVIYAIRAEALTRSWGTSLVPTVPGLC